MEDQAGWLHYAGGVVLKGGKHLPQGLSQLLLPLAIEHHSESINFEWYLVVEAIIVEHLEELAEIGFGSRSSEGEDDLVEGSRELRGSKHTLS